MICLLLFRAPQISVSKPPWARFFWKTFYDFFFASSQFLLDKYIYPMESWCQVLATHYFFAWAAQQPENAPNWVYLHVQGGFTVPLPGCHVENLHCSIPWKICSLVAFKFCPQWLGKPKYVVHPSQVLWGAPWSRDCPDCRAAPEPPNLLHQPERTGSAAAPCTALTHTNLRQTDLSLCSVATKGAEHDAVRFVAL